MKRLKLAQESNNHKLWYSVYKGFPVHLISSISSSFTLIYDFVARIKNKWSGCMPLISGVEQQWRLLKTRLGTQALLSWICFFEFNLLCPLPGKCPQLGGFFVGDYCLKFRGLFDSEGMVFRGFVLGLLNGG